MRVAVGLLVAFVSTATGACAHLPRASSPASDTESHASDGLTLSMPFSVPTTVDTVVQVLRMSGYLVDYRRGAYTVRTTPRLVGGDTSMVVTAEVIPVDLPHASAVVALSGTFSVSSLGIRNAQVLHSAGPPSTMWLSLQAIENALRRLRPAAAGR